MYLSTNQFDGEGPGLQPSAAVANNPAASPVTAAQSVNTTTAEGIAAASSGPSPLSMTSGMSSGPKPTAPKPIDKSNWDRSVKVSPATVAAVKAAGKGNMGAAAAAKVKNGAPGYYGSTFSPNAPVSAEYKEAVKRVYPSAYNRSQVQYTPSTGPARGGSRGGKKTFTPPAGSGVNPMVPPTFTPKPTATAKPTFNPFPPILPPVKK